MRLTNQARASAGLRSLKVDSTLTSVARWRSKDMIQRGYFSHSIPGSGSVFDVLQDKGYCFKVAGENIGWNSYPDDVATRAIHLQFMDSSGHRANILGKAWDVIGVGAYKGPSGKKMWTVLFADRCGGSSSATPKPAPKPTPRPDREAPAPGHPAADPAADPTPDPEADAQAHARRDPRADPDPRATRSRGARRRLAAGPRTGRRRARPRRRAPARGRPAPTPAAYPASGPVLPGRRPGGAPGCLAGPPGRRRRRHPPLPLRRVTPAATPAVVRDPTRRYTRPAAVRPGTVPTWGAA